MKIVKKMLLVITLFLLFACNISNKDVINFIKNMDNDELNDSLREFKTKGKIRIVFDNPDYYYIVAKKYYELYGFDDNFKYFIEAAVDKDNIFNSEALDFYINSIILEDGFSYLKEVVKQNSNKLNEKYRDFLIDFSLGKDISEVNSIYNEQSFFPVLNEIIKHSKNIADDGIKRIVTFFINSKLDKNYYLKYRSDLENIVSRTNSDIIKLLYFFINDNESDFVATLDSAILPANDDELFFIRDMCLRLKVYSDFYSALSKLSEEREDTAFLYCYGMSLIEFKSKADGIDVLKRALKNLPGLSILNYEIRAKILYSNIIITEQYISDVVSFVNDYPSRFYSRDLLLLMLRNMLEGGKGSLYIPFIKRVNADELSSPYRAVYYYLVYLIDRDNQKSWLELLKRDYPLSYPTLRLTNGSIEEFGDRAVLDIDLSSDNVKKILYYFDFYMIDDIRSIDTKKFSQEERAFLYETLSSHYYREENYFNSIKFTGEYAAAMYGDEIVGIDKITLLKLFPLYYYDIVKRASLEFGIEEALILAVIREESRFSKEIMSHANAKGLMQIIDPTAEFIAKKIKLDSYDLGNPEDNIRMGTYYLKYLFDNFSEVEYVLASYNGGMTRAKRWRGAHTKYNSNVKYEIIPIEETRHYIRKVMRSYYIYKHILEEKDR